MIPPTPRSGRRSGGELPPAALEGWFALHQSFRIDWPSLKSLEPEVAATALRELEDLLAEWGQVSSAGWSAAYRPTGAGFDLLFIHFRESIDLLMDAAHRLQLMEIADVLLLEDESLSVVEMGLYAMTLALSREADPDDPDAWQAALAAGLAAEREKSHVPARLYPVQPDDMPYVCNYPMDKRRNPQQNWYMLSLETRTAMMAAHGTIGRRYAGRIRQVIGASMGLGDWEWMVTLWAADPIDFKHIISDMRYDEASAEYAEFGPFVVGKRLLPSDVAGLLPEGSP